MRRRVPHFSRVPCARSEERNVPLKQTQRPPGAPFLARPVREKWGAKHPVQAAQGGILHQSLGIRTGMTGDLG